MGGPLYGLEREARASRRGIWADDHPVVPRFAVFGPRQHCHTQPTGRLQTVTPVLRYGTLPAPTALISYGWEEPPVTDPMQTINAKAKETALAMLGLTVLAIQGFERAFALVYLHHRTAVRVGPRLTPDFEMGDPDYRTPTRLHIKNLRQAGRMNDQLAARLLDFVDKRHDIVHRWTTLHGWPADDDAVAWVKLLTACVGVMTESNALIKLLAGHVQRLDSETDAEYSDRLAAVFKIAGATSAMTIPNS